MFESISERTDNKQRLHVMNQFYSWTLMPLYLHSYCSGGKFICTKNDCDRVCSIYGDGHHITFDDKRFEFSGQCEYTLVQVRWQMDAMHLPFPNLKLVWKSII